MEDQGPDIGAFGDRFSALVEEARQYGIESIVILSTTNPFDGGGIVTELGRCDPIKKVGHLQYALWQMEQRCKGGT